MTALVITVAVVGCGGGPTAGNPPPAEGGGSGGQNSGSTGGQTGTGGSGRAGSGGSSSATGGSGGRGGGGAGGAGGSAPIDGGASPDGAAEVLPPVSGAYGKPPFVLRDDWTGPCSMASTIDVNLGNTPETFVRAAHCQVKGKEAPATTVTDWAQKLRTLQYVRRIDVVNTFCKEAGRTCKYSYSDPWRDHPVLDGTCTRKTTRELGAVFMIWASCPGKVNCRMDWANTHALGMERPHKLFAFDGKPDGLYVAENSGWWRRELMDARQAGLSFVLPNIFGDELQTQPGRIGAMVAALEAIGDDGVKIGMFDDTWGWGREDWPAPFDVAPNLAQPEAAANTLYMAKWQPYFRRIPRKFWYLFKGRPLIYFYNANTLEPSKQAAPVIRRMKELFAKEFGVEPFVAVDEGYFDDPTMTTVADARFKWSTWSLPEKRSRQTLKGVTLEHFMVKWDSLGRDAPGDVASATDRLWKGPEMLEKALDASKDAQLAVIATWNDLGEGTGVERNYDYFYKDGFLPPDYFISVIRRSQCSN
ncbi:MAG TPA: DUF5010 domain-containing protein [Polyangia bacterium]